MIKNIFIIGCLVILSIFLVCVCFVMILSALQAYYAAKLDYLQHLNSDDKNNIP